MSSKPTIVLTHGAYAESSSWNDVIKILQDDGHRVIAFANPLRGVTSDAAALTELVRTIEGPVVLAGHSYGGAVMTNVPADAGDIVALVFVGAFALTPGESPADASSLVPGSTLGDTLEQVPMDNGDVDTYIAQDKYHHQFAADVDAEVAKVMAVTQRPITAGAGLNGASGDPSLWQTVPSWFVFGELDRNIPVGAHRIMAERAGSRNTVEIAGASHVVGISHPTETAQLILEAARTTASADA